MQDEPEATGLPMALMVDALLGLDIDVDEVLGMTEAAKVERLREAARSGQLTENRVAVLRELGVPI